MQILKKKIKGSALNNLTVVFPVATDATVANLLVP